MTVTSKIIQTKIRNLLEILLNYIGVTFTWYSSSYGLRLKYFFLCPKLESSGDEHSKIEGQITHSEQWIQQLTNKLIPAMRCNLILDCMGWICHKSVHICHRWIQTDRRICVDPISPYNHCKRFWTNITYIYEVTALR